MAGTAAVATLALVAGTTAYSISESEKAKSEAGDKQRKQEAAQKKMADDLALQDQQRSTQEAAARNQTSDESIRSRQRILASASGGRKGTILTSPLGLPAQPSSPGKTLLGY